MRCRRAIALLVVLATIAVAVAALSAITRIAGMAVASRTLADDLEAAEEVLRAAHGPILRWLNDSADAIALPPDNATPEVSVLDDYWYANSRSHALRITAWDQCGMVPWSLVHGPLGEGLSAEVVDAAMRPCDASMPRGLDLLEALGIRVYPRPSDDENVSGRKNLGPLPAVGAFLATHNPRQGASMADERPIININTAPIPLLEASLRLVRVAGLEDVIQARRAGRQAPTNWRFDGEESALGLSARSASWAFRIDSSVGRVRRSMWEVYVRHGYGWNLVQRLVITE